MTRQLSLAGLLVPLLACSSAHADRIVLEERAPAPRPARAQATPYEVELIGESGRTLPTFQRAGRFYVLGDTGQAYSIRVTNPTDRRIEAVISVDGLDAIDGQTADFRRKRGYVVPPRGELVVPGWRVSTQQVATFRFSSVGGSYAGRKGEARNVGVIGVAIFEERPQPEIIVREQPRPPRRPAPRSRGSFGSEAEAGARPSPSEPAPSADSAGRASRAPASRRPPSGGLDRDEACCDDSRPGLGTEFGERRHSAVSFTSFVRRNQNRPTAIATLRYNDRAGLRALGIPLEPTPDRRELLTRESADPFPGRFAEPPR